MFDKEKTIKVLQSIITPLSQQADGHLIESRIFASEGYSVLAKKYEDTGKTVIVPALFIACIILPAMAPMYVLRCPRISLSSWSPPREILWYFLPSALATDFPRDVLPVPGGP